MNYTVYVDKRTPKNEMPHFFSVIFQNAINACAVAEIVLSEQAVALSVKKNLIQNLHQTVE